MKIFCRLLTIIIISIFVISSTTVNAQSNLPTQEEVNLKNLKAQRISSGWQPFPTEFLKAITGPEQDCGSAIPVCNSTYTETNSYTGSGSIQEVNGTCLSGETNSVWYTFTVQNTGTFAFDIATANDYDFALYDITTMGCAGVPTAIPDRCNFSATNGSTGLVLPASGTIPLSETASGSPTMPGLNVTAGTTYALIIDNWSGDDNGYTITFSGTASIFDATPPTMTAVNSCTTNEIFLSVDEDVLCSSVAQIDFILTNTTTSTDFTSAITAVTGVGCTGTTTSQIDLTHDGTLTSGSYEIEVNTGPSLQDQCGNIIAAGGTITFDYLAPLTITPSVTNICNSGDPVTLTTNNGMAGETYTLTPGPVSNTTGIFVINPTTTTTYQVSMTFGGCTETANQTITLEDNVIVSIDPVDPTICSGTATLTASTTINGVACPTCTYVWSTTATTAAISVGAGTYTVNATTPTGCASDNTASSTVSLASAGGGASCDVIYVSPAGGGDGLTKANPTTLAAALTAALCTNTTIKMQTGTYNFTDKIDVNSYVTIEGGYNAGFTTKTSDMSSGNATTLVRSNAADSDDATDCTMFDIVASADAFRIQDIRIEMPSNHAVGAGVSNYGIKLGSGAQNFNIVRCYIDAGTGADGSAGGSTTVNFTSTGADTWTCPAGVTSATVTAWGAGGGGGGVNNSSRGAGGGGGGGCSQSVLVVVPTTVYNLTVGAGGAGGAGQVDGTAGGQSWFNNAGVLQANGGSGGLQRDADGGEGGAGATVGVGTSTFTGGNGRNGRDHNTGRGGAGGGGAGTTTNGGGGATTTYGTAAGAGGATGGGNGGAGGTNGNGNAGSTLGGGGSGAGDGTPQTGGNGARGEVEITYTTGGATGGDAVGIYGATDVQTNGGAITDCQIYAVGGASGGTACWLCDPADDGITGKNLTGQTIITMENFNCTTTDIDFVKPPASSTLGDAAPGGYCGSSFSNQTDDWITNVTFNTIFNNSGQEGAGSYGDYTVQSTNVTIGSIYNLSVSFSSAGFTEHVWAWFDWNQDGDFADAGESYDLGQGADATLNINITIPGGAVLGKTRFRVTEQWNVNPIACASATYGETEDYECQIYSAGSPDWSDLGVNETATMPNTNSNLTTQYTAGSFGRKDIDLVGAGTGNISMCGAQTFTSVDGRAIANNGCEASNTMAIPAQSCNYTGDQITVGINFTGSGTCWAIYLITPYGDIIDLEFGNTPGWSNGNITFNDAGSPQGLTGGTNTGNFQPNGGGTTWCTNAPTAFTLAGINGGAAFNMGGNWQLRATRGACAPGAATFNSWSISVPSATSDDGTTYPTYNGFGNITMNQPSSGNVSGVTDVCPDTYSFASSEAGTPGYTYAWTVTDPAGGTSTVTSPTLSTTDIDFTNTTAATISYTVSLVVTSECCGPLTQIDSIVDINPLPGSPGVVSATPSNCIGGADTLEVSPVVAGTNYVWYDAATAGTILGTGFQYEVDPTLTGSTSYWVEATNSDGCVSATRTQVDLTGTDSPPATAGASNCAVGILTVSVTSPVSGASYLWYDAAAGGTLLQSGPATTYDVNVPATGTVSTWVSVILPGGCSETTRTQVDATVTPGSASTTWTGATSTDWFDNTNWTDCVPNCNTNVTIANTAARDCDIIFTNGGIASSQNITIESGRTLSFADAKAILEVCGDYRQDGVLNMPGRGKVVFSSTTAQQNFTKTTTASGDFYLLQMNNTWSTPTITVTDGGGYQDMTIRTDGQLLLTAGVVATIGSRIVDVLNTDVTSVNGHSATSYVNGDLRRSVNNTGSYDFPVGTATAYENINIDFTSNSIGYLTTRFDPWGAVPNPGAQGSFDCGGTMDMTSLDNGYWTTTAGANPTVAVYDVTLYNTNYTNAATGWTVMKNSGAGWVLDGACDATSPITAVKRLGQSGFSFQATAQSTVSLPIELLSFTGVCTNGGNVQLEWITSTEINNDFFTIERSIDAIDFEVVVDVGGAGNSNTLKTYLYEDSSPYSQIYYRLKQTDFNGDYSYSDIISVSGCSEGGFDFVPYQKNNSIILNVHTQTEGDYNIEIVDLLGKIILQDQRVIMKGSSSVHLKPDMASGTYFVRMQLLNSQKFYSQKMPYRKR